MIEFWVSILTTLVDGPAIYALDPLTTSLIVSAASSALGFGANQLFNQRPEVPDFSSEVEGKFNEAKRELSENFEEKSQQAQADAAAAGVNPVSVVGDVIDSNNQAMADLMAKKQDAIARAENREKELQFGQDQKEFRARAQGIGSIVNSISQAGSSIALQQILNEETNNNNNQPPDGDLRGDIVDPFRGGTAA